jgi:predicted metal-binding protein
MSKMKILNDYVFLEKAAVELGAGSAKVIPAGQVVVEDRVRLKCRVGCPAYGTNLKCPPYVPTPDEFRKLLNDYGFAMVVKHRPSPMPEDLIGSKNETLGTTNERLSGFRLQLLENYRKRLTIMLELEKAAFGNGYTFATAFVNGFCPLCEKCNVEKGICLNPTIARISAEAVGVNLEKTAENAEMVVKFSLAVKSPEPMAILLID